MPEIDMFFMLRTIYVIGQMETVCGRRGDRMEMHLSLPRWHPFTAEQCPGEKSLHPRRSADG